MRIFTISPIAVPFLSVINFVFVFFFLSQTAWSLDFDPNVPSITKQQFLGDLKFIETISGDRITDLHKKIFGKMSGSNYKSFFDKRINSVSMEDCGNPIMVLCVNVKDNPNRILVTNNFVSFNHPQIARIMLLFHESRHSEAENDYWRHVKCPIPFADASGVEIKSIWTGSPLSGQPSCDKSAEGSYSSSAVLLKNVEKFCKNCSEKVKSDAGIYANDQKKRLIEPSEITRIEADFATK